MSEQKIRELRDKAAKARHLANLSATDERVVANLNSYAEQLEAEAAKLEAEPREPLSPQAMDATTEPDSAHAMAALKIEVAKEPEGD